MLSITDPLHCQRLLLKPPSDLYQSLLPRINALQMDLLDRAYSIPALAPTLDHDLPGRLLCPVRALKWYMKRTKFHRRDRRQLWLSCQLKSTKDITKSTVASWLKKTIVLTYAMAEQKTPIYGSLRPHKIRAIATSLATWKTVSVEQIVSTCQWSSQNTFTSFYLRDVAQDCVGLHKPSPPFDPRTGQKLDSHNYDILGRKGRNLHGNRRK